VRSTEILIVKDSTEGLKGAAHRNIDRNQSIK